MKPEYSISIRRMHLYILCNFPIHREIFYKPVYAFGSTLKKKEHKDICPPFDFLEFRVLKSNVEFIKHEA